MASVLHPPELLDRFRADDGVRARAEARAEPWRRYTLDDLWSMVFGPRITRSWMVWSDGDCPSCGRPVNMYAWEIDPFAEPWKLRCPHCEERFPKNDFAAFHESGLDEAGLFDPERADRGLLFNTEHPDPGDPQRDFGVDDGGGFPGDRGRWRFIGTWLVYGQWKGLIVDGVERLAAAYAATGDAGYARKAGVLLDRVADVYPAFDFGEQAVLYERKADRGYVSTWHDACDEVQRLVLAYDQVRPALLEDGELLAFVKEKARRWKVPSPKESGAGICAHIESRILRDTLENTPKIQSNFPSTDVANLLIRTVLNGREGLEEVYGLLDEVIAKATRVDGLTGEKGMAGYAAISPRTLARCLSLFARADDAFLPRLLERHPALGRHWRFHVDAWVGQRFYPDIGDSGAAGAGHPVYCGALFDRGGDPLAPSDFSFFEQLHEATGDAAFVQVLHHANGGTVEGLPHDPGHPDPAGFRRAVAQVVEEQGPRPAVGSFNRPHWGLAVLRSGDDRRAPTVWLDTDSGAPDSIYGAPDPSVRGRGAHGHADGLNLGLYYRGVDLMVDLGYPPVNYGGWDSPEAEWYRRTASHNTVCVDGLDQATAAGETLWWLDGDAVRGICVAAPGLVDGGRCERTLVLVNTGEEDAYLVDVHRVRAGRDHARFLHAAFGSLTTDGLRTRPAEDYGHGTLMRNFRLDPSPPEGWTAEWRIEDVYGLAPPGSDLRLRYTDVSRGPAAGTCEGFALIGHYGDRNERWLPRLVQRHRAAEAPLTSVFAGVLEPFDGAPAVCGARRLDRGNGADLDDPVELEISLADGGLDRVTIGVGDDVRIRRSPP